MSSYAINTPPNPSEYLSSIFRIELSTDCLQSRRDHGSKEIESFARLRKNIGLTSSDCINDSFFFDCCFFTTFEESGLIICESTTFPSSFLISDSTLTLALFLLFFFFFLCYSITIFCLPAIFAPTNCLKHPEQHVPQTTKKHNPAINASDLRAKDSVKSFKVSPINLGNTLDNLTSLSASLLLHESQP